MKGNNSLLGNNNSNNLSPINTFRLEERFNPLSNNNNNLSSKGLDSNVVALVNTLTEINLIKGYFLKEESFIKLTEFARTKNEDSMNS